MLQHQLKQSESFADSSHPPQSAPTRANCMVHATAASALVVTVILAMRV
jgi:hypothetical protein